MEQERHQTGDKTRFNTRIKRELYICNYFDVIRIIAFIREIGLCQPRYGEC